MEEQKNPFTERPGAVVTGVALPEVVEDGKAVVEVAPPAVAPPTVPAVTRSTSTSKATVPPTDS